MIRTNLSTRPFYNVRAVRGLLAACALIVLAITAFNAIQLVRLSASQRTLGAQSQQAEEEAARLRAEAAQILARIDASKLQVVAEAASEANAVIDQRTFSWTALFTHFEGTLPPDVRITRVTPQPSDQTVLIRAEARNIEDLEAFIDGLEGTGAFRSVLPTSEVTMATGVIEATIAARYEPPARRTQGGRR